MRTILLCLGLTVATAACSPSDPASPPTASAATPATAKPKDPAAARKLIEAGATVFDVRSPEEFAEGHLPTATNIPVDQVDAQLAAIAKLVGGDKAKPVVVYCASGARARTAQRTLEAAGYSQVVNGGGYDDLH